MICLNSTLKFISQSSRILYLKAIICTNTISTSNNIVYCPQIRNFSEWTERSYIESSVDIILNAIDNNVRFEIMLFDIQMFDVDHQDEVWFLFFMSHFCNIFEIGIPCYKDYVVFDKSINKYAFDTNGMLEYIRQS